jgi:hypothetical protein
MAIEYMSAFFVNPVAFGPNDVKSSGAYQRTALLFDETSDDWNGGTYSISIGGNPKSVRRGLPWGSMRIFDCVPD